MKRCVFLCAFGLLLQPVFAQTASMDSLPTAKKRKFEIGLNITNTISSLVGSTSNSVTTDPYLLSLRIGGEKRRMRMAVNFRIKSNESSDINSATTKETDFNYRIGFESVHPVSRHFALYWGVDAVTDAKIERVKNQIFSGTAQLRSRLWGFGGGPVLGVQWRVHPRVMFSTESSMYAIYRSGFEEVDAPPDFSHNRIKDFVWQPLIPSSLYVNFIF